MGKTQNTEKKTASYMILHELLIDCCRNVGDRLHIPLMFIEEKILPDVMQELSLQCCMSHILIIISKAIMILDVKYR